MAVNALNVSWAADYAPTEECVAHVTKGTLYSKACVSCHVKRGKCSLMATTQQTGMASMNTT